ncbi:hypothetical protein J6590_084066 [Homalodisca vitripennis]|nr:hypothetical protein J6590_084066 [Homalodisca vitripennis]
MPSREADATVCEPCLVISGKISNEGVAPTTELQPLTITRKYHERHACWQEMAMILW